MKLPKIQQQNTLKTQYFKLLTTITTPNYSSKISYQWKLPLAYLIQTHPLQHQSLQNIINLQKQAINKQISLFYIYFFLQSIISSSSTIVQNIKNQISLIQTQKSDFHQITHLINIRQNILSQLQKFIEERKLQTYSKIDDLRFINLQLIKKINKWKQKLQNSSFQHPVIFLYKGDNYLVKIINDNLHLINHLNLWKEKLIYPPNPFFLNQDGTYQGMTQKQYKQIENSMEILANQKAQQLKSVINPPNYVSKYSPKKQQFQLSNIKNQLQSDKKISIQSIYLHNSQTKQKKNKQDIDYYIQKGEYLKNQKKGKSLSPNSLQKMIKESQIAMLKQLKSSKIKKSTVNFITQHSKNKNNSHNPYRDKIDSLRNKIQKNIKYKEKEQFVKNKHGLNKEQQITIQNSKLTEKKKKIDFTQVKQQKPKIKLVTQKQSIVEDVVKTLISNKNLQMYKSLKIQKNTVSSSLFKSMEKIEQQNQDKQPSNNANKNFDIKPVTQKMHSRTLSMSFLKNKSLEKSQVNNTLLKENKKSIISQRNFISNNNNEQANLKMSTLSLYFAKKQKKKNLSKSKDIQKSQSFSPNKNKDLKSLKTQQNLNNDQEQRKNLNNIDESLRMVKGRLRQLSIKKIYQSKQKAPKSYRPQISRNVQKGYQYKLQNSFQEKSNKKSLIKNNTSSNFRKSLSKSKFNKETSRKNEDNKVGQAAQSKQQMYYNIVKKKSIQQIQLENKNSKIIQLQSKLAQKQQKIKKLSQQVKQGSGNVNDFFERIQAKREKNRQQFQKQKLRIMLQNRMIEQKMKQQQQKQMRLKQEQMKLKQQQMKRKYNKQLDDIKQQYNLKIIQAEQKRKEQENKKKQAELKIIQQNKKIQQLKMQIQKKQLQQDLLQEMLRKKENQQKQIQQERLSQLDKQKQLIEQQLKLQEQQEKIYLQQMERQNQMLKLRFEEVKIKNKQIDEEKNRIQLQIAKLDDEIKQKVMLQKSKQINQNFISSSQRQNQLLSKQIEMDIQNDEDNNEQKLQDLKMKLKKQILQQIIKRRKQQAQQEQIYQQQRMKRVKQIEQQIKMNLKKQQEQSNRIQKEFKKKNDNLYRKQLEWGINNEHFEQKKILKQQKLQKKQDQQKIQQKQFQVKRKQQIIKLDQQQKNKINIQDQKQNQKSNQIKNQKQVQHQRQKENFSFKNQIHQKQGNQIKQLQQQKNQKQNKQHNLKNQNLQEKSHLIQQIKKQSQIANQSNHKQQPQHKNVQQSGKKIQIQNQIQKNNQTSQLYSLQNKQQTIKKEQTILIKPTSQQVLLKYQNLQQYLKKTKQIFIQDSSITEFLSIFYSQIDYQVKQMIPYSQTQMEAILRSRKVDIFDSHSIGWIEKDHYILIGNIECVQAIGRKYGQIQIEIRYIFNKSNPYQKQFLAKKIKIFQHIGYVYQKKLKQDGKFSIKFIIKIPKQVTGKDFKKFSNMLSINSLISIERRQHEQNQSVYSEASINYLLSQTLKNNLSKQQISDYLSQTDYQSKELAKLLNNNSINSNQVQTSHLDDAKTSVLMSLNIPYIQFYDNPYFTLKGQQYIVNQADRIFVAKVGTNLSCVIIETNQHEFSLDMFLSLKISNIDSLSSSTVNILIPVWETNKSFKFRKGSPRQYVYRQKIQANFNYGSIIDTSIRKDVFKRIEPPFIFSVFQSNSANHLIRTIFGTVIKSQNLIKFKK